MNRILGGTFVKEGKDSLELTANDLYDRIINLKFIRKSGRGFTLRSDYEPVFHNDDTVSFKRCVEKPDIKVSYKQVAESVAIEVDIEITNFFIGDSDKESPESMNTVAGDPVQWCIVQMGYRAQFPDWTKPERRNNISQFHDPNNNAITSEAEVRRGRQILVQILTGYPKTYPPDKVTYFKGIIGTMETGLRWNHTEDDLVKGYGDPDFPQNFSEIEEVLFQFVTRRFIKPSIQHVVETVQDFTNKDAISGGKEKSFIQKVKIYGYKEYLSGASTAAALTGSDKPVAEWEELPVTESGIMSIEDAKRFGIVCAVSKTLRSVRANALYGYGLTPEQAEVLRPIPPTPFNDMQDTIGGQLVAIQQHYPFIRWYPLSDGSFFFYHERDTDKDLYTDPFIKKLQKENTVFLPAVYDMTPSGTRTIRCPFISFLSPMMTVLFQSRFTLGTLVSFFYTPKTNAFLVITAAVEFATVQDANMMELMCVDLPPHEVEVDEATGEVTVRADEADSETPEVVKMQQKRNMQWIEQQLKVVRHRTGAMDTDSRWENIVKADVLSDTRPDRWPEGQVFTEKAALEALKEWNPGYFDEGGEYMARGNSIENNATGIGGRTGIRVPWLKEGDIITVRHPFQSEYPEEEKAAV
jgi:hypothetical protein